MKQHLSELIRRALDTLTARGQLDADVADMPVSDIRIDRTRTLSHGDLASNIALTLAKRTGQSPRQLAELICAALPASDNVAKTAIAGPGFINFFLSAAGSSAVVKHILAQGGEFGRNNRGRGRKVQVEFVSANPTGPLHIGHGRGAAVGDCIAKLLEATGWQVEREFYYNDAGAQIEQLARSVQARCKGLGPEHADWPKDGYRGDYIKDVAADYLAGAAVTAEDIRAIAASDPEDLEAIRQFAVASLRREQDLDLQAFGVNFNSYFLESSLYRSGDIEATMERLTACGHSYGEDGALWLRTTDFGDDKDRVMRKSDGSYTYFLPDVAYHYNKWQRGFARVINEQGADHHGTINRVRAGLQALERDIPAAWPEYVLHQMVTVIRDGKEVKISKRAGSYVTLRELIDEVGRDASRYFLAARAPGSQLTFDIDLALAQSSDNPVYYIQYAHARICSVMRKLDRQSPGWSQEDGLAALEQLTEDSEKILLKRLEHFPELVDKSAEKNEPHAIARYLRDLAGDFHSWYNAHKVLAADDAIRNARLALSVAVRQVIANGLQLLGVNAPERM